jgi:cysteinyl-tRNA synthetase
MPLNFRSDVFSAAQSGLRKAKLVFEEIRQKVSDEHISVDRFTVNPVSEAICAFEDALSDDLNTPRALASFHSLIKFGRQVLDDSKMESQVLAEVFFALCQMDSVLGLFYDVPKEFLPTDCATDGVNSSVTKAEELAQRRFTLKKEKNFAAADLLRKEIESLGFIVRDFAEGFELVAAKL